MVYQFYVVEIKQNAAGEYEHHVDWAWDEDADKAQLKAESKYYEILSTAAVSEFASHAVTMFSAEGFPMLNKCYKHTVVPEETPEEEA